MDINIPDNRGIVLDTNINLDFLRQVKPQYFDDYIKFVVNTSTNQVAIGMQLHKSAVIAQGDITNVYGGNIFLDDGHIIYESTLNVPKNIGRVCDDMRIITDKELISTINATLFSWVDGAFDGSNYESH